MIKYLVSPLGVIRSLTNNYSLIFTISRREILSRYTGSLMGLVWTIINPICLLGVYCFVFGSIFQTKWSQDKGVGGEFAVILFAGLIIFTFFSECLNRAPLLILSNQSYVKKVVFPLEILSWVSVVNSGFHGLLSAFIWMLAYIILIGALPITILYLPMILVPLIFLIVGISWAISALGVYIRDMPQFVNLANLGLMYFSPIFYPAASIPEKYKFILYLNPLTPIIEMSRDAMVFGRAPDFLLLLLCVICTFLISWVGLSIFQITRRGFSDVL